MPHSRNKFVALALMGTCAFGVYKLGGAALDWMGSDDVAGVEHFENQVWLERLPTDERDMIGHLVFVNSPDGKVGVVGKSSMWRHFIEVFLWNREGDRVKIFMPQDRQRAKFNVRTWDCENEAPEPFELCLEIRQGSRTGILYSRYEWVVRPHMDADEQRALIESTDDPALARALARAVEDGAEAEPTPLDGTFDEAWESADGEAEWTFSGARSSAR